MNDQPPNRRNPLIVGAVNLRSAGAMVVAAALGAGAGATAAARLPSDKFAWTGLALLPLFVLLELFLGRLAVPFDDDRNAARFALAVALVVGFYGAWFGVRTL